MAKEKASAYFEKLGGLLGDFSATSGDGSVISFDDAAGDAAAILVAARDSGCKVMNIGNGGSAAIASHLQIDLCNAVGVKAITFSEAAVLTAMSNDYGYQYAFERLVEQWAQPGDVLIAISSSGQSENIIRAAKVARDRQCRVVTMSGFKPDNPLRSLGEINFYVSSDSYGYVELAHSVLAHYLTDQAALSNNSG